MILWEIVSVHVKWWFTVYFTQRNNSSPDCNIKYLFTFYSRFEWYYCICSHLFLHKRVSVHKIKSMLMDVSLSAMKAVKWCHCFGHSCSLCRRGIICALLVKHSLSHLHYHAWYLTNVHFYITANMLDDIYKVTLHVYLVMSRCSWHCCSLLSAGWKSYNDI